MNADAKLTVDRNVGDGGAGAPLEIEVTLADDGGASSAKSRHMLQLAPTDSLADVLCVLRTNLAPDAPSDVGDVRVLRATGPSISLASTRAN